MEDGCGGLEAAGSGSLLLGGPAARQASDAKAQHYTVALHADGSPGLQADGITVLRRSRACTGFSFDSPGFESFHADEARFLWPLFGLLFTICGEQMHFPVLVSTSKRVACTSGAYAMCVPVSVSAYFYTTVALDLYP